MKDLVILFSSTWYIWVLVLLSGIFAAFAPKIKGFFGEKSVQFFLSTLDKEQYKIINDLMVHVDGKSSQIDHVVISNYGIFVIETKNYKGWILGDEHSQYWTQVIYKRKEKLYNPIKQNSGHVQTLRESLKELGDIPNIPFYPIVVFTIKADLKVNTTTPVIYTINLPKEIKKQQVMVISDENRERIYGFLNSINVRDRESRSKHVEDIRDRKSEVKKEADGNSCPKCGAGLIMRKGKYGSFKGCSKYPSCRYTVNV